MPRLVLVAIAMLAPAGPIAVLGLIGYDAIATAAGIQALVLVCVAPGALCLYLLFRRPLAPILYVPVAWGFSMMLFIYLSCSVGGDCL